MDDGVWLQEAVINELKSKTSAVREKKLLQQDEVYNGALEDILIGLKAEPYRRADAGEQSFFEVRLLLSQSVFIWSRKFRKVKTNRIKYSLLHFYFQYVVANVVVLIAIDCQEPSKN